MKLNLILCCDATFECKKENLSGLSLNAVIIHCQLFLFTHFFSALKLLLLSPPLKGQQGK